MQNKTFEGIKENKLFTWIDPDFKSRLKFDQKKFFSYKQGSIIYRINDESDLLYLVVEGEVKLKYYNYEKSAGSGTSVVKIKNDFFGEKEIIYRIPRATAASAKTDCLLYGLNINDLPRYLIRKLYYLNNAEFPEKGFVNNEKEFFRHSENNPAEENSRFMRIKAPGKMNYFRELESFPDKESLLKGKFFSQETNIINNIDDEFPLKRFQGYKRFSGLSPLLLNNRFLQADKLESAEFIGDKTCSSEEIKEWMKKIAGLISNVGLSANKIETLLNESARIMLSEKSFLFSADNQNNELTKLNGLNKGLKFKIGLGITGSAAEKKEIIFSNSVKSDERFISEYEGEAGNEIKSMLCFPVADKENNLCAVFQFINRNGDFTEKDKYLLEMAAPFFLPFTAFIINCEDEKENKILLSSAAANISYKLTGSIQSIKSLCRLLHKLNLGFEPDQIAESVYRQADFIESNMMFFTECINENVSYRLEKADINGLIEDSLLTFAEFADSKNIRLYKKFNAKGLVLVDKKKFEQACFNIISNLCRLLPEAGKIFIKSENENNMIRIEFKDSTPGIPEEITEKIFNSFTTSPKDKMFGVSLAITEAIVKKFGGFVESAGSRTQGAKLIIHLPLISN